MRINRSEAIPTVPIIASITPLILYPINFAMFTEMGLEVTCDNAITSTKFSSVT